MCMGQQGTPITSLFSTISSIGLSYLTFVCVSFIFRTVSHHLHPAYPDTPPESAQDPYTDALV